MREEARPETEYTPVVETRYFTFGNEDDPFELRCGKSLPEVTVAYETWGDPANKDRAILVLHALTGDAHAAGYHSEDIARARAEGREPKPGWWDPMIGPGRPFDTDKYYVICANVLGGCKGSTGPSSINPATGQPWGSAFPFISIKDMVNAQVKLIDHLGIDKLFCVAGGSMGGMQALRWAVDHPQRVQSAIPIATTARHSAQNIAFYEVGRHAIISDPAFLGGDYYGTEGPRRGLAMARMMAHITYMSEKSLHEKFARRIQDPIRAEAPARTETEKADNNASIAAREASRRGVALPQFQVNSYLHHQGSTFVDRFDANSYLVVTRALDYFDLGADFDDDLGSAFSDTQAEFLVISFSSDWHYPPRDSKSLVNAMRANDVDVTYSDITADWGHDSFLVKEVINGKLGFLVRSFLDNLDKELTDAEES